MEDGSQDDLVGAALQDDLNISLQKTGLCEEFGLGCERLRCLYAICFPLECGTLEDEITKNNNNRTSIKTYLTSSGNICLSAFDVAVT